ncbi:MAG TPA: mersacidin/lichenicidin family type 2 lantibiotic [Ktedonosporobacter sp.]|nr:mersacidin/lichenicidin family type 2 lantibiotic [Ktedonosporobacter sp.]
MSTEEIIQAWKQEQDSGKKLVKAPQSSQEPEKEPAEAPANPVGEIELSDEELEAVEGGGSTTCCDDTSHNPLM